MRFEILGPLRVRAAADGEVPVTPRRERVLLVVLLLHANKIVTVERLVEAIWQERVPNGARNQLHGCMSKLRKRLSTTGSASMLVTEPDGYRIVVDKGAFDLFEFRSLITEARVAAREGTHDVAAGRYRMALALWRGPALDGIDSLQVHGTATRLEEERVRAWEECLECELKAGAAGELVAELTELVEQHPLRESTHRTLMLALYRSGRQADALDVYRRIRRRLADELGTDPGEELQQLHQAILNRDAALTSDHPPSPTAPPKATASATGAVIPRELPAMVSGFTGRVGALVTLNDILAGQAPDRPLPVVISAIAGTAGVGKTALAIHWAHQVASRFLDGQLYLNLRGYAAGTPPLRSIEALAALLRSLGTPPEQIPAEDAQATALYRTRLADRKMLIVLDNARSSEQVRPLIPGTPGCVVLVTSRDRLTSLVAEDGARRLTLDVLTADEANTLLVQLLGKVRVKAEPKAAAALARACAYLPLALRIAAANLAEPVGRSISGYLTDLTPGRSQDADDKAEAVSDEAAAVYAALDTSFQSIPPQAQRLSRLLGLVPGPDVTPSAAAALAGISATEARRELRRLAAAHLVDELRPDRFSFHDLLRQYARHLTHRQDRPAEREYALRRLLTWYLHTANAATTTLHPTMLRLPLPPPTHDAAPAESFTDGGQAMAWLETERPNLVAAIRLASDVEPASLGWLLADRLRGYLLVSGHTTDWSTVATTALTVAEHADAPLAAAAAHISLGDLALSLSRYPEAAMHYGTARNLARSAGWTEAEPVVVAKLGRSYWYAGQLEYAAAHLRDSVALDRDTGPTVVPTALGDLGCVYQELGRLREAADCLSENVALRRRHHHRPAVASALNNLGMVYFELGSFREAADHLTEALQQCQELGLRYGEASTRDSLAAVHRDTGRLTDALDLARTAVALTRELGVRRTEANAVNTLGSVQMRRGQAANALRHHQTALEIARGINAREAIIVALLGQATAYHQLGKPDTALANAQSALTLARESLYRVIEGQALTLLAELHLTQHRPTEARDHADQALATHQETGYRLGEARTIALLSRIANSIGDSDAAVRHERNADVLFAALGIANPDETSAAPT